MTKRWTILGLCVMLAPIGAAPAQDATTPEGQLRARKIELPKPAQPTATYLTAVRVGDLLYISGTGPGDVDGKPLVGRLGADMDIEKGRAAARRVGLQVLAQVKAQVGSLDRVERLVKTLGMVNATPDFKGHSVVVNGFSDLMVDVFGATKGRGARSSVGMSSLPNGIPVEIEAIFQLKKE